VCAWSLGRYILEGPELEFYQKQLLKKKTK
jgi:hypothetical protein